MTSLTSIDLLSSLKTEIGRKQSCLKDVDNNLKRLTGRDFNEPRGERRPRMVIAGREFRDEEPPAKRRFPGGVFARLGAPVLEGPREPQEMMPMPSFTRRRVIREVPLPEEFDIPRKKPMLQSSISRPISDGKTRNDAVAELTKDKTSKDRNRRMFGALMGTLQRFRNDEVKLKEKDDKRAKIEQKLEEKGRAEKEEMRKEKALLISQKRTAQESIKQLEHKMLRVSQHEEWETHQRKLKSFIRTKAKPSLFWLPKHSSSRSIQMYIATNEAIENEIKGSQTRLKRELDEILPEKWEERNQEDEDEDQGKGGAGETDTNSNGSNTLDYDGEEGELVIEAREPSWLPGKDMKPERVVVQVDRTNEAPMRRVELVQMETPEKKSRKRTHEENGSEKENKRQVVESERRKEKEKKGKERVREKKSVNEECVVERDSQVEQKKSPSKKSSSKKTKSNQNGVEEKSKSSKGEKEESSSPKKKERREKKRRKEEEVWSEDLSHISLPLEPAVTELVVSHGNGEKIESILIPTSQIKKDKTTWDPKDKTHRPLVIKKEKNASPKAKNDSSSGEGENSSSDSEDDSSSEDSSPEKGKKGAKKKESSSSGSSSEDGESSSGESSSSDSSAAEEEKKKKKRRKESPPKKERSKRSSRSAERRRVRR